MFRDRQSELQRLEEALLAEEEEQMEEIPDEDAELLQIDTAYSNYANGYQIYNTDRADTDLEEYSEDVYQAKRPRQGIWIVLLFVSLLILGFLGGWICKYLGVV